MINRKGSVGIVALLTSAVLSACGQLSAEEQSQPLGEASQEIIGGTAVTGSAYAIATARHCTPTIDLAN
jgi:hypothetical protein